MGASTPGTPRLLRAINDRAALELLLEHGPLSRPQLGALIGLSKPTASQLLARLEATGLVVQDGVLEGSRGPSAQLYAINPRAAHVCGIDVTPQRMDVAVADITGATVAEHVLPTPGRSAAGLVGRVRKAVEGAAGQIGLTVAELRQIVIGTPGAINPRTGQLGYARHLPGWHASGVLDELRDDLGVPIDIENDVNLAAVAELWQGQAGASDNFALLWVSEGLGLAIVLDGALHRGTTGGAGEVGYLQVPGHPLVRNLGRTGGGGFQAMAGAPAVLALARSHGLRGKTAADATRRAAAAAGGAEGAAAAGPAGTTAATAATAFLAELGTRLATGLSTVVAVLDPELIVLTGEVALAGGEPLRRAVEAELHALAVTRPRLLLSSVTGNPVRSGAIHAALTVARHDLFGSTVPADPPPSGPGPTPTPT